MYNLFKNHVLCFYFCRSSFIRLTSENSIRYEKIRDDVVTNEQKREREEERKREGEREHEERNLQNMYGRFYHSLQ